MDTMVSFRNDDLSTTFLSKEDIRAIAPKVLLNKPSNPNVSSRYAVASTETVIDDLAKLGWLPVVAKQQKMRKESSVRSFHIVAFQNPSVAIKHTSYVDDQGRSYAFARVDEIRDKDGNIVSYIGHDRYGHTFPVNKQEGVECYPRIVLTNSYDGFNAFTFRVSFFRLVCSNGLVVATDTFMDVSIRHTKYSVEALNEVLTKAIIAVDEQIGKFNDMRKHILSDAEKVSFVESALRIRNNMPADTPIVVDEDTVKEILNPVREADENKTLYGVFNIIQEKITKGGVVVGINGKKARKMRGIKSFSKDLSINQKLYQQALSYIPVKEVAEAI